MINPRAIGAVAVVLLFAVAGLGWFWDQSEPAIIDDRIGSGIPSQALKAESALDMDSPFAVKSSSFDSTVPTVTSSSIATQVESQHPKTSGPQNESLRDSTMAISATEFSPLDISRIGLSRIEDGDFKVLVNRLRADSQLLQQLIDQFRQESNPLRLSQLARLLGEVGGPDVTLSASELIFSGDVQSRSLGLELLQRVQPGSSDARDIVSGLLATEVDPDVLVGTLTTLASPGEVEDVARANLSEQVAYLTEHDDAAVRAISLNILSRWTTDSRYTSVLIGGLDDPAPTVRESAVYALVGYGNDSQDVMDSLFTVVGNNQENEPVRRGAILALRGMALSDAQRVHIAAVERVLDSRPR